MPPTLIFDNGKKKDKKFVAESNKYIIISPDGVEIVDAPDKKPKKEKDK